MQDTVGVVFRRLGKLYHFDPDGISLMPGDSVIVMTKNGMELGEVSEAPRKLDPEYISSPLKKVIRRANEEDLAKLEKNREKEAEASAYAKKRIAELKLEMQLFQVERSFDSSKMMFHFTAESRVDFRDLVKDLAAHFKTRIELRQIGVRDKAKMIGGLGHCGQNLCCASFLHDLNPVSIRMAKEQDLSLNPIKISGVCGRLMCCLQYEYGAYKDFNKRAPGRGACVETCEGHKGCVISQNPVKERLKIRDDDGLVSEIALSDVEKVTGRKSRDDRGGRGGGGRGGGRGGGDGRRDSRDKKPVADQDKDAQKDNPSDQNNRNDRNENKNRGPRSKDGGRSRPREAQKSDAPPKAEQKQD